MRSISEELSTTDQLNAIQSFVTLAQNPATFSAIYDLDEILRKTELSTLSLEYLTSQPDVAAIIQERYLAPIPDLDALLTYPQESLGYAFAAHLNANQFDPEFYRKRPVVDDLSYILLRRSQTHDICHVVTGFGTDPAGELALQAFQMVQMRSPIAIAILTAGIINGLESVDLQTRLHHIHRGWQMGFAAKPLMAQKWEEAWEKPLSQWRSELGLEVGMA